MRAPDAGAGVFPEARQALRGFGEDAAGGGGEGDVGVVGGRGCGRHGGEGEAEGDAADGAGEGGVGEGVGEAEEGGAGVEVDAEGEEEGGWAWGRAEGGVCEVAGDFDSGAEGAGALDGRGGDGADEFAVGDWVGGEVVVEDGGLGEEDEVAVCADGGAGLGGDAGDEDVAGFGEGGGDFSGVDGDGLVGFLDTERNLVWDLLFALVGRGVDRVAFFGSFTCRGGVGSPFD